MHSHTSLSPLLSLSRSTSHPPRSPCYLLPISPLPLRSSVSFISTPPDVSPLCPNSFPLALLLFHSTPTYSPHSFPFFFPVPSYPPLSLLKFSSPSFVLIPLTSPSSSPSTHLISHPLTIISPHLMRTIRPSPKRSIPSPCPPPATCFYILLFLLYFTLSLQQFYSSPLHPATPLSPLFFSLSTSLYSHYFSLPKSLHHPSYVIWARVT